MRSKINLPKVSEEDKILRDMPSVSLVHHRAMVRSIKTRYERMLIKVSLVLTTIGALILLGFILAQKMFPSSKEEVSEKHLAKEIERTKVITSELKLDDIPFKLSSFDSTKLEISSSIKSPFIRRCLLSDKKKLSKIEFWTREDYSETDSKDSELMRIRIPYPEDKSFVHCAFSINPALAKNYEDVSSDITLVNEKPLKLFVPVESKSMGLIKIYKNKNSKRSSETSDEGNSKDGIDKEEGEGNEIVSYIDVDIIRPLFVSHRCVLVYEEDIKYIEGSVSENYSFYKQISMKDEKFELLRVYNFTNFVDSLRHVANHKVGELKKEDFNLKGEAEKTLNKKGFYKMSYRFQNLFDGKVVISCSLFNGAKEYLEQGLMFDDKGTTKTKEFFIKNSFEENSICNSSSQESKNIHNEIKDFKDKIESFLKTYYLTTEEQKKEEFWNDLKVTEELTFYINLERVLNVYDSSPFLCEHSLYLKKYLLENLPSSSEEEKDNLKEDEKGKEKRNLNFVNLMKSSFDNSATKNALLIAKYFHYILMSDFLDANLARSLIPFEVVFEEEEGKVKNASKSKRKMGGILLPEFLGELEELTKAILYVAELIGKMRSPIDEKHSSKKVRSFIKMKKAVKSVLNDFVELNESINQLKEKEDFSIDMVKNVWKEFYQTFLKQVKANEKILYL